MEKAETLLTRSTAEKILLPRELVCVSVDMTQYRATENVRTSLRAFLLLKRSPVSEQNGKPEPRTKPVLQRGQKNKLIFEIALICVEVTPLSLDGG